MPAVGVGWQACTRGVPASGLTCHIQGPRYPAHPGLRSQLREQQSVHIVAYLPAAIVGCGPCLGAVWQGNNLETAAAVVVQASGAAKGQTAGMHVLKGFTDSMVQHHSRPLLCTKKQDHCTSWQVNRTQQCSANYSWLHVVMAGHLGQPSTIQTRTSAANHQALTAGCGGGRGGDRCSLG